MKKVSLNYLDIHCQGKTVFNIFTKNNRLLGTIHKGTGEEYLFWYGDCASLTLKELEELVKFWKKQV